MASSDADCVANLIPADRVTFLKKEGAFTPLYEPAASAPEVQALCWNDLQASTTNASFH
jgi:hypothetical protein